ncbi:MAG: hypothetical protein OEW21_13580 [Betaproteobacteria bacterium]|nr:hypothetical protein [Betaproteobacteria bacterium]
MTLDDVYGADADAFPLEQDAANWEEIDLEWDDEDTFSITSELSRLDARH